MAAERKYVNLDQAPQLREIVGEVRRTNVSIALVTEGEIQATVEPPRHSSGEAGHLTESEKAAFRATGGSWKGLMDAEQFLREIEEGRQVAPRPAVEFDE